MRNQLDTTDCGGSMCSNRCARTMSCDEWRYWLIVAYTPMEFGEILAIIDFRMANVRPSHSFHDHVCFLGNGISRKEAITASSGPSD